MPGLADSFWSTDYVSGLKILFDKLQQGTVENRQVLMIARLRPEAEESYGICLGDAAPAAEKITGGFSRDDGATVRKAYDGVRVEMVEASKHHLKIAQNIRDLVVSPFSRWCDAHEARVQGSQAELLVSIKTLDRLAEGVKKLRATYFNKCRLVEDIEEENKLAFQDYENSPKGTMPVPEIKVSTNKESEEVEEPLEIGDDTYSPEQIKKTLAHILSTIKLGETRVPILGTYQNTSTGSDIVEYLQQNMGTTSVSYAERIGQDFVSHGFLRLVGNVGSTFANSSKMYYQWRPKAFKLAGVPEKKLVARTSSLPSLEGNKAVDSVSSVGDYLSNWNPLGSGNPNETPAQRLQREAYEADEKYKSAVRQLDQTRCELEEAMFTHLRFMEQCELDRLKAIKTVILDFSGAISNVIPSLQSTVDKMLLFQETVQPASDLRYLLENYRTGSFMPKVVVYENYYKKIDNQTFGIDLDARSRADKKRVPAIVTSILTYLDSHYPDLEGDEARRSVWLADVPLVQTHKLRARVNAAKACTPELFSGCDIPAVASLLKLYFLELPDSLVSSQLYEVIKHVYNSPTEDRLNVIQKTLSQLRISSIATLDACMNHLTRLIELTSADEAYVTALATTLVPCVLRPRTETALTMEEKHAYRLVRDLFDHKDTIFAELKRLSSLGHSTSVSGAPAQRPRQFGSDEHNRRAHVEERNKALLEKASGTRSRAPSPAPGARTSISGGAATSASPAGGSHRRDRSVGGPETRFPVHVSPSSTPNHRASISTFSNAISIRQSLEVPMGDDALSPSSSESLNGTAGSDIASPPQPQHHAFDASLVEKRNSLGRSGAKFVGGRRLMVAPHGVAEDTPHRGVTLEDKPMDD